MYLIPEQDEMMDVNDMLELLDILIEKADEVPFKMILNLSENNIYLTRDARNLYKTNAKARDSISAQAAVFNSISTQILFDLVTKIYTHPYPLKAFRDVKEAELWIRQI